MLKQFSREVAVSFSFCLNSLWLRGLGEEVVTFLNPIADIPSSYFNLRL
jgi:hypothetical protein